ncbi:CheY chemotaxis protein or a CheY-like REC (receiver) domain [Chitinophaga sp. YR573]|uniref:response regulator n=1 Tax=Chitinophaga sp. YR573 TaxID=1881040 RepID=UPI0008AABFFD|nr:response regulator [Chitinophaga sp. YR573]SEW04759.1 CheY chemotaxis protein or a CheY-like REC (receiver) domain [Chitinophaga sp. YR573]
MYKKDNITFEEIPFNLPALISSIKSSFEKAAKEKGIRLIIRRDIDVPDIVIGDPLRLTQVLNKLISNAMKFTDEGSVTMDVSLNNSTPTQVYIDFSVEDTGIGIDDALKVFTGSLAITKQLLLLQDSDINFQSIPGTGSVFSFCLAFTKIKETTTVQSVTADIQNFAGKKVLLAEDDDINRMVVSKFLQNWLLKIDYAITGKEAVDKVKENDYDLILMDLQMPGLNGYEASQQIRAAEKTTPIIALTAHAIPEIKSKTIHAGMNDCIGKPFNPDILFKILSQYLADTK